MDLVIGASCTLENFTSNDAIESSLDIIGSVSSAVSIILNNILAAKI